MKQTYLISIPSSNTLQNILLFKGKGITTYLCLSIVTWNFALKSYRKYLNKSTE